MNFGKIDPSGRYAGRYQQLVDHLPYYDHFSPDWVYDIPKDSLLQELKGSLELFGALKGDELEKDLLLGELAHYLYNLDVQKYYDTAETFFMQAIRLDAKDCRGYWFLGYHYAQSNEVVKGVSTFEEARRLASDATPGEFWQEYAFAMMLGSMPSHCRYGLDRYKRKGGDSQLFQVMDSTLRSKTIRADADSAYTAQELWESFVSGTRVTMMSRPLGISLEVDSNASLQVHPLGDRKTAIIIQSPLIPGIHGRSFGYNIALIMKVAGKGEDLNAFVTPMVPPGAKRDSIFPFASVYPHGISYTLRDNSLYTDRGGAHIHFIAIERESPAYPGLLLENHAEGLGGKPGEMQFYTLGLVRDRFPGRIFYFFVLDTCGDIYKRSWEDLSRLFMKEMILE